MLCHGFATETEFKVEMDRHLRALAKRDFPPADVPRDNVPLPLAIIATCTR